MLIEPAKLEDVPRLAELLGFLFDQEHEFSADPEKQRRGIRMILENPSIGEIFVARDGGQIVGMVNILFTVSTALGQRVAILEDLVVEPKQRGKGIGSKLLTVAIERAKSLGMARMTLTTDHDNAIAQKLYEQHGFQRSTMLTMRLSLET